MSIFLRTDNHVASGKRLASFVESIVAGAVQKVQRQVTRVDVYLRDENGSTKSGGHEYRCSIEARIGGLHPFAVTSHGETLDQSIRMAGDKLRSAIASTVGKISRKKGRIPSSQIPLLVSGDVTG